MNLKDKYHFLKTQKDTYLSLGDKRLDVHMGGLTRKSMHVIAGSSKSGKSKFTTEHFIIQPYLDNLAKGSPFDLKCAFYSFEMDKETVQFEFAAYFFGYDHGIRYFNYTLSTGEQKTFQISGRYLQSNLQVLNNKGNIEKIKVSERHEHILFEIIEKRIEPMFRDYIWFQEKRTNPTGIHKDIWNHMESLGTVHKEEYLVKEEDPVTKQIVTKTKTKVVGYTPNNPNLFQIIVIDHVRKINKEQNAIMMKQIIDLMSDYAVQLRNLFHVTFAMIVHTNRQVASVERQKHQGDELFPSADDIKDSSNLGEDANFVWTLFNPTDERYALTTHFKKNLKDGKYEFLRTLHLVEARSAECPAHWAYDFNGAQGHFQPLT